jgi:hypothetical protein
LAGADGVQGSNIYVNWRMGTPPKKVVNAHVSSSLLNVAFQSADFQISSVPWKINSPT